MLTKPAAGAELGPDQVLVAAYCRFRVIALPVLGGALPADAAALGHEPDVAVARALPIRVRRARSGWDDHLGRWPELPGCGGLVDGIAVIGAVRGDAGQGAPALAQPAVLGRALLALAEQPKPRAIQHQVHRPGASLHTRLASGKGPTATAQRGVVRHDQSKAEQLRHAAGEPFRLPQGQVEHEPQGQCQFDRRLRVARLPAGRAPARCLPSRQRYFLAPERQGTTPAKSRLVGWPVRHPTSGLRSVMAARGVVLERYDRNISVPSEPSYQGIHVPTPSRTPDSVSTRRSALPQHQHRRYSESNGVAGADLSSGQGWQPGPDETGHLTLQRYPSSSVRQWPTLAEALKAHSINKDQKGKSLARYCKSFLVLLMLLSKIDTDTQN